MSNPKGIYITHVSAHRHTLAHDMLFHFLTCEVSLCCFTVLPLFDHLRVLCPIHTCTTHTHTQWLLSYTLCDSGVHHC